MPKVQNPQHRCCGNHLQLWSSCLCFLTWKYETEVNEVLSVMSRTVHGVRTWCLQQVSVPHWISPSETWLLWSTLAVQSRDTASNGTASLPLVSTTVTHSASTITTSSPSMASMQSCIRFGNCWFCSEPYRKVPTIASTKITSCALR